MSENRYDARQRRRKERAAQWRLDEDMRRNDEVDRRERRATKAQAEGDERLRRQVPLLVAQ